MHRRPFRRSSCGHYISTTSVKLLEHDALRLGACVVPPFVSREIDTQHQGSMGKFGGMNTDEFHPPTWAEFLGPSFIIVIAVLIVLWFPFVAALVAPDNRK